MQSPLLLLALICTPLVLAYNLGPQWASRPSRDHHAHSHAPQQLSNVQVPFTWNMLEFSFPSEAHKQKAVDSGNYVPNNGIPIDVQPYYYRRNKLKTFVTIPRFQGGVPYTLATVSNRMGPSGPMLQPYPSYEAHNVNGDDCNKITSIFRVEITECNQMWAIDSGTVGMGGECPPQLLLFDLNTDQLIHSYKFNTSHYTPSVSLLVTPIVVVRDPAPRGNCRDAKVYIADVTNHGVVIYDFRQNRAWRAENAFMYPDPDYGTHTVAGESFTLMDGILGMTTDTRNLYFHPMASISEYSVPLRFLDNSANFATGYDPKPEAYRFLGKRTSECAATDIDSFGNVYCVTFNPIELIAWNVNTPYNTKSFRKIPIDPSIIEFVSGMKVVRNHAGQEQLWMMSNRFQRLAAGTQKTDEPNFRVVVLSLSGLMGNGGAINQDLHNRLVFSN